MSGDVVAAIDAALADYSIGPDAMRHAPDAPEPAPNHSGGQFDWLPEGDRRAMELLTAWVDGQRRTAELAVEAMGRSMLESMTRAMAAVPDDFALMPPRPQNPEPFGFTTDDIPTLYTGLLSRRFAPWPKYSRVVSNTAHFPGTDIAIHYSPPQTTIDPDPLVTYEPSWPPPFVAYTGQTAITMEAPGE